MIVQKDPLTGAREHGDRPAWPEITAGFFVMAVVGFGFGSQIPLLGLDPVSAALILTGWSGVAGLAGFGAAWLVRMRPLKAFGVQSTSRSWLLIAVAAGMFAFLAKGLAVMAFTAATGINNNPQGAFVAVGDCGALSLIAATLLLGVLTPVGEEFLFRGVLTAALLRYGTFIGVVLGAVIFALLHGINIVFPAAIIEGLIAGELFRRSASIWPPVIVHVVYNLPTIPVMFLAATN